MGVTQSTLRSRMIIASMSVESGRGVVEDSVWRRVCSWLERDLREQERGRRGSGLISEAKRGKDASEGTRADLRGVSLPNDSRDDSEGLLNEMKCLGGVEN